MELRLVLLGKTGDGKSSTGNSILKDKLFQVSKGTQAGTQHNEMNENDDGDRRVKVVDTPGFCNSKLTEGQLTEELKASVSQCAPGPHAFIIVLRVGKYTAQEKETVSQIGKIFGKETFNHAIVLFTHGDQLAEDQTIEQFVDQSEDLKTLVQKCGGRCHVIDNKRWNEKHEYRSNSVQLEKLLHTVEEMANNGCCYTTDMVQATKKATKKEAQAFSVSVVLLGKTGDGKSSSGNSILGDKFFKEYRGTQAGTQQNEMNENDFGDRRVKVVDTPGFFNSKLTEEQLKKELETSVSQCSPGAHAFIIVLRVGKYTAQEKEIVSQVGKIFGKETFNHAVVLFTWGDQLETDQTIEKYVGKSEDLKELVDKCGGRCHVIDNKRWNQEHEYRSNSVQLEKLLNTIEEMANNGCCYTPTMLQAAKKESPALDEMRIVLLGRTGDGKSSSGNSILGDKFFKEVRGTQAGTQQNEMNENDFGDRRVKVVDTPGFFNSKLTEEQLKKELEASVSQCSPGAHAFIIVLRVGKYTAQEKEIVSQVGKIFGKETFNHAVVLFTWGDQLENDQTIEKYVGQSEDLKELVEKCGGRYHVIDNKRWNQEHEYRSNSVQLEKLLNTIEEMANNGCCYTPTMLQAAKNEPPALDEMRLVLLGKTGYGKSSAGNTILGDKFFKEVRGTQAGTQQNEMHEKDVGDRRVKVVDTPGFFNSKLTKEQLTKALEASVSQCAPGPHAFIIVLRMDKYTAQEKEIVSQIGKVFGKETFNHAVVLFTWGDQLENDQTIEKYVGKSESLKELVQKCGGRYHVIDNKRWNQEHEYRSNSVQVEKLMNTVEEMAGQGSCYTMDMLQLEEMKRDSVDINCHTCFSFLIRK